MEEKVIKEENLFTKPTGEMYCVYFSSASNNTQRFVEKVGIPNSRIPIDLEETITVDRDYVLISPTYSGGGNLTAGAVPKQVIKFLNNPENRSFCRGVIGSGNTNFGNTYGLAGKVLAKKLKVPLLYTFEISGTIDDIKKVKEIIQNFWAHN